MQHGTIVFHWGYTQWRFWKNTLNQLWFLSAYFRERSHKLSRDRIFSFCLNKLSVNINYNFRWSKQAISFIMCGLYNATFIRSYCRSIVYVHSAPLLRFVYVICNYLSNLFIALILFYFPYQNNAVDEFANYFPYTAP